MNYGNGRCSRENATKQISLVPFGLNEQPDWQVIKMSGRAMTRARTRWGVAPDNSATAAKRDRTRRVRVSADSDYRKRSLPPVSREGFISNAVARRWKLGKIPQQQNRTSGDKFAERMAPGARCNAESGDEKRKRYG